MENPLVLASNTLINRKDIFPNLDYPVSENKSEIRVYKNDGKEYENEVNI